MESSPDRAPAPDDARLDKWLWTVRAYKTRALAAEACRLGRVTIDGREAKPAATVRAGQVIEARQGTVIRRLVVLGIPRGRQGPAKAREFVRDETPPESLEAARQQRVQQILAGGPRARTNANGASAKPCGRNSANSKIPENRHLTKSGFTDSPC